MARSFSYVSNPFTGYRGGGAYRSEDPTFNVQPTGFAKAAGLSTLPSVYKSIRAKRPDYEGIGGEFATADAINDASIVSNAGTLIANENKLQRLDELQSLRAEAEKELEEENSSNMVSSGLKLLGGVGGAFIPGIPGPVGSMVGSTVLGGIGDAIFG